MPGSPQDAFSDAGMVTCEYFHFVAQKQVGGASVGSDDSVVNLAGVI